MPAKKAKRPGKTPPARRTSGDNFRVLFEQSPDAIYIHDLEGRVLEANRTASKTMGYSLAEFRKMRVTDVDAKHVAAKVPERITTVLAKTGAIFESEHKKRDGSVFPVEVNTRPIEYMGKPAIISVVRDITQRKADEERQARLAAIVESSNDAIITLDMADNVTDWNKGAERIFGYAKAEMIGRPVTVLSPDPDKAGSLAILEKVHRGIHLEHVETRRRRKDGEIVDISLTLSPLKDHDDRMIGSSGTAHDITGRKKAEAEIRELNRQLERRAQASEAKYQLLFDNIDDTVLLHDAQGNFLDINRGGLTRLGYSKDEVLGMNLAQFDAPEAAEKIPENMAALLKTGHTVFESVQRRKDGAGVPVEVSAMTIDINGKQAILSVSRDMTARKAAAAALHASEEKYRKLVETTATGYLILDWQGRVADANAEYVRMTGHKELGEILGRSVTEWTADHEKQRNAEAVARCLKDGFIRNLLIDYADKSGRITPIEINATVEGKGKELHIVSLCRDITARKLAEAALRESENKYRLLVEGTNDVVYSASAEGVLTYISPQISRYGWSPEELIGQSITYVIADEDKEKVAADFAETLRSGSENITEFRVLTKARKTVWFSDNGKVKQDDRGNITGAAGVLLDITDRKLAERELQRKSAILQTQQDSSIDGILMVEKDQTILNYNKRFVEIWGIPQEVMDSRSDERAIGAVLSKLADPEGFLTLVRHLYTHNEQTSRDELLLKDGRILDRYSSGIFGPGDEYYGRIWYFRDVTERRQAEETIKELNKNLKHTVTDLREANKELEAFTYSVSHDLRTPLRHMTSFAKLLDEEAGDALKGQTRHYLDVVSGSAKQMDKLITSLLAFSKLARTTPEMQEFSGNELAEEVAAEIREDSPDLEIEWKTGGLPALKGDRFMLKQVFINLLCNAVKYSAGKKPARIEVFARAEGDETIIGVRDNGIGFDMKLYDRLFGVFQRLHGDDEFEGAGVGLANVKSVISKHGGRVWAETIPDKETTFYFSLPAAGGGKGPATE